MNADHDDERDPDRDLNLASAYLDGAASADEIALVESDPRLVALVDRLAALRDAVADVDPPSEPAREQALGAALAAFDAAEATVADADVASVIDTGPTGTGLVTPLPSRHRWRWGHGFGVAAAAVLVVAGGIALLRDDAEAPTASREAAVPTTVLSEAPALTTAVPVVPTVAIDDSVMDASAADAAEAESASVQTAPVLEMSAAEPAAPAPAVASDQLEHLDDSGDLWAFAITVESPPPLAEKRATCDPAGPAEAPDAVFVTDDGVEHRVVVVRLDDGAYGAIDVETCAIVAETTQRD